MDYICSSRVRAEPAAGGGIVGAREGSIEAARRIEEEVSAELLLIPRSQVMPGLTPGIEDLILEHGPGRPAHHMRAIGYVFVQENRIVRSLRIESDDAAVDPNELAPPVASAGVKLARQ